MRFTLPLALLALAATTISASAENPPRHPEHWTLLMPTVTAATNCISQMVLANAGASSLARQGKWLAAITAIGDACDPPLRRMEAAHNQLYGPGTGRQFLTGAYAADVPRAVAVRVQPKLDRLPPKESSVSQTAPRSEESLTVLNAAAADHWQCIRRVMVEIVPFSTEPADTVATAVVTRCNTYEEKRVVLAVALFRISREQVVPIFAGVMADMQKQIVMEIVTFRAKTNRTAAGA